MENPQVHQFPLKTNLTHAAALIQKDRIYLIGVDGGSGAGKTTFTLWFAGHLRAVSIPLAIVHLDHFVRPSSEREEIHAVPADIDWPRLKDQVLGPLRVGRVVHYQRYDWIDDRPNEWVSIAPGGAVIIDGVTALREELAVFYNLRIWLSCPQSIRSKRLLGRGDTPRAEIDRWQPSEAKYLETIDPETDANLVMDTSDDPISIDDVVWFVRRWTPPDPA